MDGVISASPIAENFIKLDGKNGTPCIFTQISCALNYIGASHTDSDFTLSVCSCFSEIMQQISKKKNSKGATVDESDVCMYFVFPEYRVAIPMRSGNQIFFNPLVQHCCSYPRSKDVYSFSAYTSTKTMYSLDKLPKNGNVKVEDEYGTNIMKTMKKST